MHKAVQLFRFDRTQSIAYISVFPQISFFSGFFFSKFPEILNLQLQVSFFWIIVTVTCRTKQPLLEISGTCNFSCRQLWGHHCVFRRMQPPPMQCGIYSKNSHTHIHTTPQSFAMSRMQNICNGPFCYKDMFTKKSTYTVRG